MIILFDTCSLLHFLASGEHGILTSWAKKKGAILAVCEQVEKELVRVMARPKFARTLADACWRELRGSLTVLSDSVLLSPAMNRAITDICRRNRLDGRPPAKILEDGNNLGEFLTASHALYAARQGELVVVVIDDRYGRQLVSVAKTYLPRPSAETGSIFASCVRDVVNAADTSWFSSGITPGEVLARMEEIEPVPRWF
ncbi:PIN domain-containing protein [Actinotignum timonense]|uniref:hypothetical protein n=1 Tax=Actinotignum TaxID=1653174 RepID=UPI00254DA4BB|nr:hypothetical protein [Actinotignum timonense]MDK6905668.1 hypothetical protein [Actinotignum timonense]MDK8782728.1 hypothetical protein [Actinotignum timonense]MDY5138820.1 hypothetical protein [Actinotignum timonense]